MYLPLAFIMKSMWLSHRSEYGVGRGTPRHLSVSEMLPYPRGPRHTALRGAVLGDNANNGCCRWHVWVLGMPQQVVVLSHDNP
jgi:hypothetical protein